MDLTVIWAAVIAFGLFAYVALDGFDLGVGIVFPFFPDDKERDRMMHTLAPIWDGNETWLVFGGAALFASFPLAYSIVLQALYLPIFLMLLCLLLRGVSFEVRGRAKRTKNVWSLAFTIGSAGASLFQGIVLGAYLQGIPIRDGVFSGDAFFWVSPFSLLTGLGLMSTYTLLGASWLVMKTDGELQRKLHRLVVPLSFVLLFFMVSVSIWTPLSNAQVAQRWFSTPVFYRLLPFPFAALIVAALLIRAAMRRNDGLPFVLALLLVFLGYVGILVSVWPYAIPDAVTLWDAAAPKTAQVFVIVGAMVIVPIIILYTAAGYWVFRHKVTVVPEHD
ncbi:cytochrome d ubiquinol oxidase subunit II [Paraburkholderia sp. BCC1884]|uniref:cytochrome d ubiquinol oxidase subunit II n=1 Tax=Paraburkholderia sp. BCC1884 TaxID=2562668 RepID=UPI0011832484|nr:cytochrome d ubiquinol oxidase subunit II [Paraburkholderia sp. BCC1884]